ncbi:hypothetical protein PGT21_015333 [Puccinia graminis f. sp. tritici]|uniref:Uncharacterized protein n=1 Tax=Puccinia graminis f. sp. tritici TaxID=56615 RepID=A0A5B0M2P3_PUCGR|nr:hypothetical protein PGT21_015333 [Puccinia graminis f. sp. tritici]KAA1089869.1 hypothetical protein PGTUg99_025055 [Puccinia graminis f. sp. tritici]
MVNALGTAVESVSNAGRAGSTLKSGEELGNTRALTFQKSIDNTPMASYQKNPPSAQISGSSGSLGSGSLSKGVKQPELRRKFSWLDDSGIKVDAEYRDPTSKELKEFDKLKLQIIKALDNKEQGFNLGNGKLYNARNLVELLEQKIIPKGQLPGRKTYGNYGSYLQALGRFAEADKTIGNAQKALNRLAILDTAIPGEQEAQRAVTTLLNELDRATLAKFQREYELTLLSLASVQNIIPKRISSFFPNLLEKNAIDTEKFAKARAIQLSAKSPEEPSNPIYSTVEEVIHALPADFDLTTELYHYSLMKGFEKILAEEREQIHPLIENTANRQINYVFKNPWSVRLQAESYINKLGEAEFERWSGEHPSTIFQKLTQTPQDPDKILYAVNHREGSLKTHDYETLREANSGRRAFRKELRIIEQRVSASQDPDKVQYLETLKRLEKEAINLESINYAYVEELFNKKLIDASTRAKLNPTNGISKQQFMEALGTQEDFKNKLVSQFKKNLVSRIEDPVESSEEMGNVRQKAGDILYKVYFDQLDKKANQFYLTREAFERPYNKDFEKAFNIYDAKVVKKFLQQPDIEAITKAYVDAHIPAAIVPDSALERFLNEAHLKSPFPKADGGTISNLLPGLDKRLAEFWHKPLVKDDERLKGTRWETLTEGSREKLNGAAQDIFKHYDALNKAAEDHDALSKSVRNIENSIYQEIPRINQLFKRISKLAEPPIPKPGPRMPQEEIKQINEKYPDQISRKKMLDSMGDWVRKIKYYVTAKLKN